LLITTTKYIFYIVYLVIQIKTIAMKIAVIVILSAASALARSCAKEGAIVAEKEGIVAAEKATARAGAKAGVRNAEIAISRAASVSARYLARDMVSENKHVTYIDSTKTFKITNIK